MQHALDGKQVNCLSSIQMLMKLSNHPRLICESDKNHKSGGRRGGKKKVCYAEDDKSSAAPGKCIIKDEKRKNSNLSRLV